MTESKIVFKQLSKIHLKQIIEIQNKCFQKFHEENINVYSTFINVFPDGAWGAFCDNELVGQIFFHPYKNRTEKPLNTELVITGKEDSMYLHEIAILPQYRSFGISNSLLKIYDEISEKYKIMNQSLVSVENSLEFWKKKGFSIIKKADAGNYLDGYLMSRNVAGTIHVINKKNE